MAIDATQVRLVTKKKVWVLDMIDDHSRSDLRDVDLEDVDVRS